MNTYKVNINGIVWTTQASSLRVAVNKSLKAEDNMRILAGRKRLDAISLTCDIEISVKKVGKTE